MQSPAMKYTYALPPEEDVEKEEIEDMESSVRAVENTLKYHFQNKKLLEEALTHPSCTDAASYERLEFVGDAVLGLAISNYFFIQYPNLGQGKLTLLRSANVSTEKLARIAVRHQLYKYVRHNAGGLDEKVKEFVMAVQQEDEVEIYGGLVKAPKVLADIVESVAAAIYVDCNFDLKAMWTGNIKCHKFHYMFAGENYAVSEIYRSLDKMMAQLSDIFRDLLEPMVMLDVLEQQPQPVTVLFEQCHKNGKRVDIRHWREGERNIAIVYVDGTLIASASSEQKVNAKLHAAKAALRKLFSRTGEFMNVEVPSQLNEGNEIEGAKQKLHELCGKRKWPKPNYKIQRSDGRAHEKRYTCSVEIEVTEGILFVMGKEKSRVKEAENSAASVMLHGLKDSNYI